MRQFLRTPALALALCAAPAVLHAQGMANPPQPATPAAPATRAVQPAPPTPVAVDANAPAAVRAREVVTLVLGGDAAALEAFVRQNADPNYAAHPQLSTILADLVSATREGARVIVGYTTIGNGIYGVDLASAAGAPKERTIMVAMHDQAPYQLRRIGMRRPAPAQ